ncbi:hypothetical protein GCM10023340_20320 [Nocardioides marinquilinus]|uniref:Aminopeptidase N n=1 Tax=Nocardioides marinquilinus TaxID=1210400 RepID=A0ABP9PQX4_9ACTN
MSTRTRATLLATTLALAVLALPSTPAQAADPVAGAQTSGDVLFPHVGNGGYDVEHYDLDLAWTPGATLAASTIDATTTIRATTTGAPLSSYSLDLEGTGLVVRSVTVNGAPAAFSRVENAAITKHKLVVTPSAPVSGRFTTVVAYDGVPSRHVDPDGSSEGWNVTSDGATFLNQPIGAMTGFPNNNTPTDKATYTIDVDVPNTITAGGTTGAAAAASNGELVAREPSGTGRTTWRWVQQRPMATELVMISIGRYDVTQSAITLASGRVLPEWSFVDASISGATKATIETQRQRQKAVIDGLETIFGPYPGGSTGVVVDVVPSTIGYALETQDRSFFPGSIGGSTLVHEIAHQWFGDNVSPTVWNEIWIAEGMGTWAPTYYAHALASPPTSTRSTHAAYYGEWAGADATDWQSPPGAKTGPAALYDEFSTYTRPGVMYEALRLSVGDAAYVAFLKEWQRRYAGQSRGYDDFLALAEEVTGRDLDAFLRDWVLDADRPAWPQRHDLGLRSSVADGATLAPGEVVTYTLSAANLGRVPLSPAGGTASVARVDLADVLDDATIDAASLPAGLALDGTTLTWTVPTTAVGTFASGAATPTDPAPTATVSFPVRVRTTASPGDLTATAAPVTLGGVCGPVGCTRSAAVVVTQPVSPSADPVVTGTPRVDVPLSATTSGWADGTTFDYRWAVGGTDVDGATGPTFTPRPADAGRAVTVTVTGSKPGSASVTRTSAPSAAVALGEPTTAAPTVTGTPRVGVELTAAPGAWTPGTAFAYRWAVGGTDVDGATGATFTPRPADAGRTVTVTVTGTRDGYEPATRTSEPTGPVDAGTLAPAPVPAVVGDPVVGVALTAVPGTWDDGVTLAYQWAVGGTDVAGATDATFTPRPADVGDTVTVAVTGSKDGYAAVTRMSEPTTAVAPGTLAATPSPAVTGTRQVGRTLTASTGTWDDGVALAVRWLRDGLPIAGATGRTHTLTAADAGRRVSVQVTGSRDGYVPVSRTSAPGPAVARGQLTRRPTPSITGRPVVGRALRVRPGAHDPGVTLRVRWYVGDRAVTGARGAAATFTPRRTERGRRVSVEVVATKPGYVALTRRSARTAPVA